MRDGPLRGKSRLTCDQCGKESERLRTYEHMRAGWAVALDSAFGPVGNDWCPPCANLLLDDEVEVWD